MNDRIGIVCATKMECSPLIRGLTLSQIESKPFPVFSNGSVFLIISGIGKCNAAMAVTYLISKHTLSTFFNIGACGAVKSGYEIGNILHVNKIIEYDRPPIIKPGVRTIKPKTISAHPFATLATQDKPVISQSDRHEVGKVADIVDMEGAGFAQACKTFKVDGYLFKIVTDTIKQNNHIDIIQNIRKTRDSLYTFFKNTILG